MDANTFFDLFLATLTSDLMRYVIGAGGVWLVINVALKAVLARRKIRAETPGWRQIRREILASLRTVLVFASVGTAIAISAHAGNLKLYYDIAEYGWVWFAASIVLIIVAHDAYFYWMHRALHDRYLWRWFHRLHHKSRNPTPFTSYAFDTGEAIGHAVFLPVYLALVPTHPVVAFIFTVHMMLRNAIGHCGVEIFPARRDGRPMFGWITGVTHHDLHHAGGPYNFGLYFTWWDRWMGTEHPRYLQEFARTARPMSCRVPVAVLAIVIAAFVAVGQAQARDLKGVYATPGLGYLVRFAPCAQDPQTTCGTILWAWDQASAVGSEMVRDLRWDGTAWAQGTLRDPETGSTYRGKITPGQGAIHLSGCALVFCQTQVWPEWRALWARLPRPE